MFEKLVVIDCRGHLLGRLASFVAKEALAGQKIMLVRAEEINISGSFIRNKLHMLMCKNKRMSTNPRRGPFYQRVKAVDGCPAPFDKIKKMVVPSALRVPRLRPGRKFCTLGRLAHETGWKYQAVVAKHEANRKAKNAKWFESKKN